MRSYMTKEDIENLDGDDSGSLDSVMSEYSAWGDDVWICESVAGITFVKVTDESQISEDNIGECSFEEAKSWILTNWDEVMDNCTSYIHIRQRALRPDRRHHPRAAGRDPLPL